MVGREGLRPSVDATPYFAQTYTEARAKFLAAATAADLAVQSHPHPLRGRDGEALAMDVARCGPADAPAVLLVSSACHGVEGFCGSGVQNALLSDAGFHAAAAAAGVAVLYIHALNPWGFSWWRRTTHENVDLNRNWQDFSQPLPANADYDELAHLLVPPAWPPAPQVQAAIDAFVARRGAMALQTAVSGGQHRHPKACSTAAATRPGAARLWAMCWPTTAAVARGWAGSTCTPAWAPAAMASASTPTATTRRRWRGHATGGAPP